MSKKQNSKQNTPKVEKKQKDVKEEIVDEEPFLKTLISTYTKETSQRVKMIDCFLAFQLFTGILVLIYGFICHNPLNSFLSALFSCMGMFVFTMALRLREGSGENSRKYFVEYVFCVILLQLSVANFLG